MTYSKAPTRFVTAANAVAYAYRETGVGSVPLVLLIHFRGNLDNWDPVLVDALASQRRVIAFDNKGVGGSSGATPHTVEEMAHDAIAFIDALDLELVDMLGFSLGSFVAQEVALVRPDLVRRLVLASAAPKGAAGMHGWAPDVIGAVGARESVPASRPNSACAAQDLPRLGTWFPVSTPRRVRRRRQQVPEWRRRARGRQGSRTWAPVSGQLS
jgi:pimeloyl-ACP methyl ester carboxylesterase